jgi:hypothetical protein
LIRIGSDINTCQASHMKGDTVDICGMRGIRLSSFTEVATLLLLVLLCGCSGSRIDRLPDRPPTYGGDSQPPLDTQSAPAPPSDPCGIPGVSCLPTSVPPEDPCGIPGVSCTPPPKNTCAVPSELPISPVPPSNSPAQPGPATCLPGPPAQPDPSQSLAGPRSLRVPSS